MNSLRVRREVAECNAREEQAVSRPKEQIRAGYTTHAVMSRTRDRQVVEEASKPVPKTAIDRRIAEHSAQVQARLAHEAEVWREQQERPIREAQAELVRRVQVKKAAAAETVRALEEEMILDALNDATNEEAQAAADIVKRQYGGSRETFVWEIALKEVRQQAQARAVFMKTPFTVLENTSASELAKRFGCSEAFVMQLMEEK